MNIRTHAIEPRRNPRPSTITERRKQVLYWMARGKENSEIAQILDVCTLTVKNHVSHILRVYGASNRISAVMRAMSRGDVSVDEVLKEFA